MAMLKSMSLQGYRAKSSRFLLEPPTEEQVHTVLKSCLSKLRRTSSYTRVIRNSQWELIRSDRIMYIYSKLRRRHIVYAGNGIISTWQSRDELIDNTPPGKFAFSHKSCIVNLDMATSVRNDEIILTSSTTLPLSTHYRDTFMKALLTNTTD